MDNLHNTISLDENAHFLQWQHERISANILLEGLAESLTAYTAQDFQKWLSVGLHNIVIGGVKAERAFSPGELVVGGSNNDWRDDIVAVYSLLPTTAQAEASQGFVRALQSIPSEPTENDITRNNGRNLEMLTVEALTIVRELRAPASRLEATPLDVVRTLIELRFAKSQAVFDEAFLVWRCFAGQISDFSNWAKLFTDHPRFLSEYSPLVAHVACIVSPSDSHKYLAEWKPHRDYRHELAKDAWLNLDAQKRLTTLNNATKLLLRREYGAHWHNVYDHIALSDQTYALGSAPSSAKDALHTLQAALLCAQATTFSAVKKCRAFTSGVGERVRSAIRPIGEARL